MFLLRGPVTIELRLREQNDGLDAAQWQLVADKLAPFINEYRLCGVEEAWSQGEGSEGRRCLEVLLRQFDKLERFAHLYIDRPMEQAAEFLAYLRSFAHVGSLVVDLPSLDNETYRAIKGFDGLAQTLAFIEQGLAAGIEVNVQTLICSQNCDSLMELAEEAFSLGINYVVFNRSHAEKDTPQYLEPDRLLEAAKAIQEMRLFGYNVALGNCLPNCFHMSDSYGCMAGILFAMVNCRGEVYPCRDSVTSVGNLLQSEVTEIWRGEALERWRAVLPSACKSCVKNSHCPGGCRAYAEKHPGQFDPLIREAVQQDEQYLHEVTLEEDLCPLPRYVARDEDFGWSLIRANRVIPVSLKAGPILKMFTGKCTLGEIEEQFGSSALSFIYSLYVRGFIEFKTAEEPGEK